jgi:hypothetical protein
MIAALNPRWTSCVCCPHSSPTHIVRRLSKLLVGARSDHAVESGSHTYRQNEESLPTTAAMLLISDTVSSPL